MITGSGWAYSEDPSGEWIGWVRVVVEGGVSEVFVRRGAMRRDGPLLPGQLPPNQLQQLRDGVMEAEAELGEPAQVRWRLEGGETLTIEPAEPIAGPLPWGWEWMEGHGVGLPGWTRIRARAGDKWSRANAGEVFPGVMTPLTWSLTGAALDRAFRTPWGKLSHGRRFVGLFGGYVYFNMGVILELLSGRLGMRTSDFLLAVGGPEEQQGAEGGSVAGSDRPNYRLLLSSLPFLTWRAAVQRWLPHRWPEQRRRALRRRRELQEIDVEGASDREIMRALIASGEFSSDFVEFLMQCQTAAFGQVQFLLWLSESWLGDRSLALRLLQGLPNVLTAQSNLELWRLAERAAGDASAAGVVAETPAEGLLGALAADSEASWLADELMAFLDTHGHRTTAELELSTPRWVEEPGPLLATFRDYVLHPQQSSPAKLHERQVADRQAAEGEARRALTANLLEYVLPARWLFYLLVLRDAQALQPLRENPKYALMQLSLEQRRLYLLLGERWARRGALERADDVFWLLGDEVLTLMRRLDDRSVQGRMRSRVRRRRKQQEIWESEAPPPLRDYAGVPLGAAQPAAGSESGPLRGIAASAGKVRGRARVATSPAEGRELVAGEILVARFTDPGWTPIFPLAAAVVTEIGGMLSHGAVVAREYGLPAVVNVRGVTTRVRTGDLIEVDGSRGEVVVVG